MVTYLSLTGQLVCRLEVAELQSKLKLVFRVARHRHRLRTETLHPPPQANCRQQTLPTGELL